MAKGDAQRVATILDVAAAAGVSRTTVSRYLSQQFGSMSPATKARIDAAVAELSYRPSRLARGLRQDKSFTIGFVVPDITNPFAISVLRGAESVAEKRGYMLMVCNSDRDPVKERRYLDVLRSYGIDGLLIFTTGHNDEVVRELAAGPVPIVLVDQDIQDAELDLVGSDNVRAVEDAVEHLVEAGYDDVAYFTDVIGSTTSRAERADVFRTRFAPHATVSARVYEADVRDDAQLDAQLEAFLADPRGRRRCLFAGHGVMMLRLYSRLKERGLRIPDEISLLGFDDDEWARSAEPPLTTISQSTRDIGARATELLLDHIDGSVESRTVTRLPARLVVRRSTLPSGAH
ncbi:LacI family transcriptional regulator [Salana multivorans]|uniref:LacI family transcriptional regulator n=1 Tax=Salana multivorans TaxID=120377 RepID=A0A3N2D8W0_9MICO|nr:LacI family DNA-binding transcriptional regulator [Salana multivorans]ROR96221.1 LacI family transcriptional regulator [Salana multivorans]